MVANLSSHKRGWDDRWETFSEHAERGKALHARLTELVDRDTEAFQGVMAAWKADPDVRDAAVEEATRAAIDVPLEVMERACEAFDVLEAMARDGLEASVSDAGVGALCARLAVRGAGLNVRINLPGLKEAAARASYQERAEALDARARQREAEVLDLVEKRLGET
jgi:glutamate formiminotransferase/formiminotetrahydrofolate cyclodeaminase